MCYPGSRLDVNTADFNVEEVNDKITTSTSSRVHLLEDIYGGDDQIFEHNTEELVTVSNHRYVQ